MLHLIWDLDGTLIDSEKEILWTLASALSASGINAADCIRPIRTGPPLDIMLKDAFPTELLSEEKVNSIIARFRVTYDTSNYDMTNFFPGIEEIVNDTDNFGHHLVTNKPELATKRILKKLGVFDKFTTITACGGKPKTEFFQALISKYDGSDSHFAGIGDMKGDCLAAKNNNIPAIGVLWGTGTREELAGTCDYLFDSVDQLRDFLYSE